MRAALLVGLLALAAAADEASLRAEGIRGRTELARAAASEGLAEEAVREWQLVLRDDPANTEALKGIEAAGRPWVRAWDAETHRRWKAWSERRRKYCEDMARRWAAVAQERDRASDRDLCWEACQRAFGWDPDCLLAHELLGEAKHDGQWVTEEVAGKRAKGLLELRGEWLPAAEVRKRRMSWDDAWEVHGVHFTVRSNRGLGSARAVLALAERAHAAFMRDILGVVDPAPAPKRLLVLDFATPDDVEAHLREAHEGGKSPKGVPGWYTPGEGVHLTALPEGSALTREEVVLHECTHAAAGRAIPCTGWVNPRPGFWAWEGVPSYFESTESREGKVLAGDTANTRFRLAREELKDGKFTPLAKFVQLDQEGLGKQYQQAASLVHFFLHAKDGKYREAFVAYFREVARGESDAKTFEKAFGRGADTFEEEFRDHVRSFR